jgi:hypothetical protein
MPVCKQHGKWPCPDCIRKEYDFCVEDNKIRKIENKPLDENGRLLLHDTESLAKILRGFGVVV